MLHDLHLKKIVYVRISIYAMKLILIFCFMFSLVSKLIYQIAEVRNVPFGLGLDLLSVSISSETWRNSNKNSNKLLRRN